MSDAEARSQAQAADSNHQAMSSHDEITEESKPAKILKIVSGLEAITLLVVLGGTLLFRVFDGPKTTGITGPIHGIVFMAYVALVLQLREEQGWSLWTTLGMLIAGFVPVGGFFYAHRQISTRPNRTAAS